MLSLRDILVAPLLMPAALLFKNRDARIRLKHVLRPLLTHVALPPGLRAAAGADSRSGVVRHVGRRSGITRETPIEPFFTSDRVLIPLAFGSGADWCRNIVAAGGCTLTFRGRELALDLPMEVTSDVAEREMPADRARAARKVGVEQYLSLRIASPIDGDSIVRAPSDSSAVV
jgi:deazaflavin-dependent oxidoreductase (nitroreductase family)